MGIFDIFKKKKNELQKVVIGKNDNEQKNNDMLAIRPDIIPQDVFRLLWFIDGKYKIMSNMQKIDHKLILRE